MMRIMVPILFAILTFTSFSVNSSGDLTLSDFYENPETYLLQTGKIERPGLDLNSFTQKIEEWKANILVLNKVKYLKDVKTENGFGYKFLLPYVLEIKSAQQEMDVSTSFLTHHLVKLTFQIADENIEYAFYDIGDEYNAKETRKEFETKSKVRLTAHDYSLLNTSKKV